MGAIYSGAPGATGREARARSLAEHATSNTTEEANDRCRTPDDSTAEDEHSDHNRTIFDPRQVPAWAPFTFQGLSCQLRRAAYGCFMKTRPARPARPVSFPAGRATRHQAVQSSRRRKGTRCRAACPRGAAREDWRNHGTHSRMRRPEGNQDRNEWMTVIEMQEYMRASRNKAYDLIWSGEIDSYRLGRKLLVSRASVDAYIESRSGRK